MRFRMNITHEARLQLRALDKELRRNIGARLDSLQNEFAGDIKKLSARSREYRLRVGRLRILFTLEDDVIIVYAVKDRRQAYE